MKTNQKLPLVLSLIVMSLATYCSHNQKKAVTITPPKHQVIKIDDNIFAVVSNKKPSSVNTTQLAVETCNNLHYWSFNALAPSTTEETNRLPSSADQEIYRFECKAPKASGVSVVTSK